MDDRQPQKLCYTVWEVQEMLQIGRQSAMTLLRSKQFVWVQLQNGSYRIIKQSFDEWLDQ